VQVERFEGIRSTGHERSRVRKSSRVWFKLDSLIADRMHVQNRYLRFRLLVLLAFAGAAVLLAPAAGAKQTANWAKPQIKAVVAHGLMAPSASAFKPNAPLTQPELKEILAALPTDAVVYPDGSGDTTTTTSTTPITPTTTDPSHDPTTTTTPSTTDPSHDPNATTTTTTDGSGPPPGSPKSGGSVSVSAFDTALVKQLGLSGAAARFRFVIRQAGVSAPSRYGTETVARLLGLRINHPASQDKLELLPTAPITRAEAAYSIAQLLTFTGEETQWVEDTSLLLETPTLNSWQKRILTYAVSFIGYPYIWGGSSPTRQTVFGQTVTGGFDCSGFVWRVYKLRSYAGGGMLKSTIRGRTTYVMSGEVGRSKRIAIDALEPGDVLFFGSKGTRSKPADINHTAIYLGDGWLIQSSGYGVAVAPLEGWYTTRFAWARRPLAEAGLENVYSVNP
jgi:cell wall-associated NlpC family hydrolase